MSHHCINNTAYRLLYFLSHHSSPDFLFHCNKHEIGQTKKQVNRAFPNDDYKIVNNTVMKTNKRSILPLAALTLLLLACGGQKKEAAKEEPGISDTTSQAVITPAEREKQALLYHETLMEHFGADWMERESDPALYPDYYGGSFIDNSGTFVVAVTGDPESNRQRLTAILGGDDFKVERVTYSYRQMMQVMDRIDAFLVDNRVADDHPVMAHFAGAYPDVMENRVKVILTEVSSEITNSFKKDISGSPMILFEKGEIPQLY